MTENNNTHAVPDGYKEDPKGRLVPIDNIREIDMLRDEQVHELIAAAKMLQQAMQRFKNAAYADIAAFVELSAERYDVKLGGRKGNICLSSFDGKQRVRFDLAERLTFDEGLIAAKALIDECLHDWTEGANDNLKAIVDQAFDTDKEGQINTNRILALRRTQIDDDRWKRAMDAISEAVQVADTKSYIRFYERDSADKKYQAISLNFADL
ncbi:MAG: sulfate transporter [Gammaproteobacteria bacterium]|nr:MAG: sulfate transporter [Gammaproteobacteria bacterium]